MAGDLVREGDHVVLDVNNGERLMVTQVTKKVRIKVGKRGYVPALPLVGHAFGTVFEVRGNGLAVGSKDALAVLNGSFSTTATEKNNARLVDDGRAQKLSHEDIEELKEKGVTGEALVEKIVENSATFEAKTEFSQEKYKRKKQKKHCTALVLCRPCAQTICEAYFQKSPARICGLRVDSLGMLLCSANVGAHSKVLVLEESSGLILASVLERLGGHGEACALSLSSGKSKNAKPPMDIVRFMNFDSGITRHSTYANLADLLKAKDRQRQETTQDTAMAAMAEASPIETSGDGSDKANGTEASAFAGDENKGAEGKTEGESSGKDVAMASPKGDTAAKP